MVGKRWTLSVGLLVLGIWAALSGGSAMAADTVDVGGSAVAYDTTYVEASDVDGADRTTFYVGDTLVAAAWDRDADGRRDLWMRVDADWHVDRVAADRDGDGIADTVVAVDHEGETTVEAIGEALPETPTSPTEAAGTNSMALIAYRGSRRGRCHRNSGPVGAAAQGRDHSCASGLRPRGNSRSSRSRRPTVGRGLQSQWGPVRR